jgi:ATP-dependent DNA ligase
MKDWQKSLTDEAQEELRDVGQPEGTGFDGETLRRLSERLRSLERETPAFAEDVLPTDRVRWGELELVARIGFGQGIDYGELGQPRFQGLRRGETEEVVKENTQP